MCIIFSKCFQSVEQPFERLDQSFQSMEDVIEDVKVFNGVQDDSISDNLECGE